MAAIEKTYTDKWQDYKDLVDWAKDKVYKCPNGTQLYPSQHIYSDWTEEDFGPDKEIPVMHTPQSLDYFLIKDCPMQFVQDRLKEVYGDWYWEVKEDRSSEDLLEYVDGIPKDWTTGRRIVWIKRPKNNKISTFVDLEMRNPDTDYIGEAYDWDLKRFLHPDELGDHRVREWYIGGMTWKAVMRRIRKMPLPSMAYFTAGDFVDDKYTEYRFFVI